VFWLRIIDGNLYYIKMKRAFLLLVTIVVLVSCESVLDEPVYHFRPHEDLFSTEGSTEAVVAGMFVELSRTDYYNETMHQLLAFHSGILMRRVGGAVEIAKMQLNSLTQWINEVYTVIYKPITTANLILERTDSTSDETHIINARGMAYFMRAFSYFNLVRLYGPTPLVTKLIYTIEEASIARPVSSGIIYEQIVADLMKALQLIADVNENVVRPKKLAVYALLAKVYLTRAGYDDIEKEKKEQYWQLAKDYAEMVIAQEDTPEGYSLVQDYAKLFDIDNENSTESIFEVSFAEQRFTHIFVPNKSGWSNNREGGWGRIAVSREWFDTVTTTHSGRDNRTLTNIVPEIYDRIGSDVFNYTYPYNKSLVDRPNRYYYPLPGIQKYKDPDVSQYSARNNFILLRYAEILLIYAEADNELNGPTQTAVNNVNKLLERSRNSSGGADSIPVDIQLTDFNSIPGKTPQEAFSDRIMVERLAELVGEGHEWFDSRRKGIKYLKGIFENHNKRLDKAAEEGIIDSSVDHYFPLDDSLVNKNMLLPIPQQVIDINNKITIENQNPGYK